MDVSIVVCCHNEEKYIDRCLRSLADQEFYGNYEIIIIDDGSTDKSSQILSRFSSHVKVIKNATKKGIGFSAQKGIQTAIGKYLVRVDADDFVSRYFLQSLFLAINEGCHFGVACDYTLVNEAGEFMGFGNPDKKPIACGVIYSRDTLNELGGYDPNAKIYEDLDLRKRFLVKYEIVRLAIPLYRYRIHKNNSTGSAVVASHIDR
jgi:glycosyltransferase involved in cell wall biosynthesis